MSYEEIVSITFRTIRATREKGELPPSLILAHAIANAIKLAEAASAETPDDTPALLQTES
jgi:DNA-binding XRE family transcriptional regulator